MTRSVLVSGGNRGLGLAIAQRFASLGDKVAVTHRREPPPGDLFGVRCDVTDAASIDRGLAEVTAQHGSVEVLVANAGSTRDGLAVTLGDDDFSHIVDVNLTGAFRLARRVAVDMIGARRGTIVFVSSAVGLHGAAGQTNYAAAKSGLIGLARSLARELGPVGVTANVVAPGLIETDMGKAISPRRRAELLASTPLGRPGAPDDVADAVVYLAGARYLTGVVLPVSGGFGMGF